MNDGDPAHWTSTLHWLDAELNDANQLFAATNVQFASIGWRVLPAGDGFIRTDEQLATLGGASDERSGIDVFVVPGISVDGSCIAGFSVPPDGPRDLVRFVAVVPSGDPVLAHELGHFFGLEDVADERNPMFRFNHPRADGFTPEQLSQIRAHADRFAEAGTPRPLALVRSSRRPRVLSDGQ